jgi:hypothetical protein
MAELEARLEVCEEQNNYFREHGERYRKKHLIHRVGQGRRGGKDLGYHQKGAGPSFLEEVTLHMRQGQRWKPNIGTGRRTK